MVRWSIALFGCLGTAFGHNLNQTDTVLAFDKPTLDLMASRVGTGQPMLKAGDTVGVILKSTPGPGTATGTGGYMTFYILPGTQVTKAEYGHMDNAGGFVATPVKGPSIMAIGDGSLGSTATPGMIGSTLPSIPGIGVPGLNAAGVQSTPVTAAGVPNGTLAGVYGDTGIFYSTSPDTVWQSFAGSGGYDGNTGTSDNVLINNRGLATLPTTRWDAEQLIAFGLSSPAAPVIDPNGRGNAPWGMAGAVAGPQSGYAWSFSRALYQSTGNMKTSLVVGPWQRIQYPGSAISKDQPGLKSTALGYATADASSMGVVLSAGNPLPPTLNWTDGTSPKAIRVSEGGLVLGQSEYAHVEFKILADIGQPNSPFDANGNFTMNTDAFGGDAGGEQGGKDHLWRYYTPTTQTVQAGTMIQKIFSKTPLAPGENSSFQIAVINASVLPLTNVVVTDPMPAGLTYLSANPAPSSTSPLTWNIGSMAANSMRSITVQFTASGTGTLFNSASVNAVRDGSPITGTGTDSVNIALMSLLSPDKTVTPSSVAPGGTVTYTVTITNNGTSANGTPLVITENLPPGFTYQGLASAQINGGTAAAGVVTVNAANPAAPVITVSQGINAGKNLTLVFTALVSATQAAGTYANSISMNYESKVVTSGELAPVTVGGGRIGDTVFRDWNGNGSQDFGEEGIAGVTVQLYNGAGTTLLATTITDANGNYLFNGLNAATYQVRITAPTDYLISADPDATLDGQTNVTLSANQQFLTADFGYKYDIASVNAASIGDYVFSDSNNNGVMDASEVGIPLVTVNLYEDTNGNGVIDSGDLLIATMSSADGVTNDYDGDTVIDLPGFYLFTGLDPARKYIVKADASDADIGTFFGTAYQQSTPSQMAVTTLVAGDTFDTADFGFFGVAPASVGDQVFIDSNSNGVFDAGDVPLSGVTVDLYRDANGDGVASPGELVASATTNASGIYTFSNLGPDSYIVKVRTNDPNLPAGTIGTVARYAVALNAGDTVTTADFPYLRNLSKTADLSFANANDVITYTMTPFYPGSTVLTNALVTDAVPAGSTYNGGASPTPTSQPAIGGTGNVTWNLGSTTASAGGSGTTPAYTPDSQVVQATSSVVDAYIDEASPATNKGNDNTLRTRPASGARKASLIRFTLPSFAATDVIDKAYIRVKVQTTRTSNHSISLYRVTTPTSWVEASINWNDPNGATAGDWVSAGGVFGSSDYDGATSYGTYTAPYSVGQELVFDVTSLVRGWRDGTLTNNGVVLVASGTDNGDVVIYSSEGGTAGSTSGPRLDIGVSSTGQATNVTVWDKFGTARFNNNDGTKSWLGEWIESGDDGLPNSGNIKIGGGVLTIKDSAGLSIQRAVDLAGASAASLTLSLTANSLNDAGDQIAVQASNNSGGSWITLDTFTNGTATGAKSYNLITALGSVSENTRIRFARMSSVGGAKSISVDDVKITFSTPAGPPTSTALLADTAMLTGTRNVTVAMTVTSSVSATVTPPTNLTVTPTGGASASKISGPTPASATAGAAGATFTWVYQVSAGASPGSVRFSGAPTGPAGYTFGSANSQSVLVTPVLTFKAKVNTPAPAIAVVNTATLTDSGGLNAPATATTATSASIGDFVWQDTDGDGVQDSGEPGLSGIRVYVDSNSNGVFDVGEPSAITDNSGAYRIYGLSAGTYTVRYDAATIPAGYSPTTSTSNTTALSAGQQYSNADFGLRPAAPPASASSVGDTVWLDANNDGVVDAGEARLPAVTVKLYFDADSSGTLTPSDVLLATTTTDTSGNYLFSGLNPGQYLVIVSGSDPALPAGVMLVSGGASAGGVHAVTLGASQNITTADYGYDYSGQVGDTVYYDSNSNGAQDGGEGGVNGAVVSLFNDTNHNGDFDAGIDTIVGTTSTNGGGSYLFSNLPPGDYIVICEEQTVVAPPGSPHAGLTGTMVGTTGTEAAVTLTVGGMTNLNADFGFVEAAYVDGRVFHDVNHNGVLDPGEPPLPGVAVTLNGFDSNGNPVSRNTVTNAGGQYSFLPPAGSYTIAYNTADPQIPVALGDQTTPASYSFTAAAGDEFEDLNFGRDNTGVIGDTVFIDANGNGAQGAGEAGLENVTMMLLDSTGTILLDTTVTDSAGHYAFRGLADGTYKVQVLTSSLPAGYNTTPTADPDATHDSIGTATVAGGGSVLTMDFGYQGILPTFSVSGVAWDDNGAGGGGAGNGIKAGTEPGLANVSVTAAVDTNADGIVDQTFMLATDAGGNYTFAGVPQGSNVTITVDTGTLPNTAYVQTGDPDATLDNQTSITNVIANVSNKNFGYNQSFGSLAGSFVIGGGNGIADLGEPGLPGVTITLTFAGPDGILGTGDDTIQTANTNASGAYSFSNLLPGSYQVSKTTPAGYASLADRDGSNPDLISATLAVGQNLAGQDFEARVIGSLTISGQVRKDLNGDGDLGNATYPGIGNVLVSLYTDPNGDGNIADGALLATKFTNTSGNYQFGTLSAGNYVVIETNPAGATSTADAVGANDDLIPVVLASSSVTGRDFLDKDVVLSSISGLVYNDGAVSPGVFGADDIPVPGVLVTLYRDNNSNGLVDAGEAALAVTSTNAAGAYSFPNLTSGSYVVQETDPAGAASVNDVQGAATDNMIGVTLAGADAGGRNFLDGIPALFSLSGRVFDDVSHMASLTAPSNRPLGGVVLELYADLNGNGAIDPDDPVIDTRVSSQTGNYAFTGLPNGAYIVKAVDSRPSVPTNDKDGVATPDVIAATINGANNLANDFLQMVDPSGYIYDPVTGQIIPGGLVSVTGPGAVNLMEDGSTGQYSFLLVEPATAGVYTIAFTAPPGWMLDALRPPLAGPFNPPNGPGTVSLGSGEDSGNPGYLLDYSAASNTWYYTFDLASGDQLVINNNIPVVPIVPTDYPHWKYEHRTPGSDGPSDNPLGCCYNNLLQFAFGLDPNTAVLANGSPFKVIKVADISKPAGFRLDAQVHEIGGLVSVSFTLESIANLASSGANGAGWSSFAGAPDTIVSNGDGSVTATYQDLEALTGLNAGQGFVRLLVTDTSLGASSRTVASGWSRRTSIQGVCQTANMPYVDGELFCGTVDSATGSSLNLATSAGTGSIQGVMLASGRACYLEVAGGAYAGHRFEIDEDASTATDIALVASDPLNTLSPVPTLAAGDFVVVHTHWTLDEIHDKNAFHGSADPDTADTLTFFDASAQTFKEYWLLDFGALRQWVATGDATLADAGGRLMDPAEGCFVTPKSTNLDQVFCGVVRQYPFAVPLNAGYNLIGGGWPMDQSPVSRGMTTVAGFKGNANPALADRILIWKTDTTGVSTDGYVSEYLLKVNSYNQWTPQGNASLPNDNSTILFPALRAVLFRSVNGLPTYVMPTPWTP